MLRIVLTATRSCLAGEEKRITSSAYKKNALRDVSGSHRAEYLLADGQPESFKGSIANTNSNGERGLGVMLLSVPLLVVQF